MTPPPAEFVAASSKKVARAAGLPRRPSLAIAATDGERLMRFRRHRDEAAFRGVVEAHAALVWGVCWQVLRHREDVEDAFQATFLILARKAHAIRTADSAAGWLYRVAFRTALAARQRRRRLGAEPIVEEPPASLEDQLASIERSEQCAALLEELHALGDRYRQPLVLCYLEGRSRQEAADEMGVTLASVKGRLARGLRLMRSRLARRGTALSSAAALLAAEMAAAQASTGARPAAQAAALGANFAWHALASSAAGGKGATTTGALATGALSLGAITLAKKGILAMKIAAAAKPAMGVLVLSVTAGVWALSTAAADSGDGDGASTAVIELTSGEGDGSAALNGDAAFSTAPPAGGGAAASAGGDGGAGSDEAVVAQLTEDVLIRTETPIVSEVPIVAELPADLAPVEVTREVRVETFPRQLDWAPLDADLPVSGNRKQLKLQFEHWTLKAKGLAKKAEAMALKAKTLVESGGPRLEILEAESEADLARADVKLCEFNISRLSEAIERIDAATIGRGATGERVRLLQKVLNAKVTLEQPLDVDGDFGVLTEEALIKFQKANGLEPTGVVDEATWRKLFGEAESLPRVEARGAAGFGLAPFAAPAPPAAPDVLAITVPPAAPVPAAAPAHAAAAAVTAARDGVQEAVGELREQMQALRKQNAALRRQIEELEHQHETDEP